MRQQTNKKLYRLVKRQTRKQRDLQTDRRVNRETNTLKDKGTKI